VAIAEGKKAPDFTLADAEGKKVSLSDFKGKDVVVYFYPKDDTPGCTKEACGFRDLWKELQRAGVVVLGISSDAPASHQQFIAKYKLPFPLLSDPGAEVAQRFGIWVEKTNYGRKYMGVERTTFLIDEDGRIADVLEKVKPALHVDDVLARI
jgi:peroxiredoxin Q/BCP